MQRELPQVPFPKEDKNVFSSSDLGCVCSLITLRHKLLHIDKTHSTRALFLFENTEKVVESAQMYWRGELQVDALTYFNTIKTVKSQLYSS